MPKNNENYAGFWIRVLANIIDGFILGIPSLLIIVGSIAIAVSLKSIALMLILPTLISLGMVVLVIWLDGTKGGTPGKLLLGLNIVNEQGKFIGIGRALLRNIIKNTISGIFCIGFIMIAFTEKKQGLHDIIAKTYVVKV